MFMGARRRMGSGVPGFSGTALPRATRSSSRGRAGGSRKIKASLNIEWLAEVAGLELDQKSSETPGQQVIPGTGTSNAAAVQPPRKQEDVKSDNESGTSFALVESVESEVKKLLIQCQMNQAPHEEEMKAKSKAEAAAAAALAAAAAAGGAPGDTDGAVVADKAEDHELPAAAAAAATLAETDTKVKDEECSSECIMSEEGMEKPLKNSRRSRKRKSVSRSCGWGSKRSRNDDCRSAKAASVATTAAARKTADGHVKVSVKSFTIPELYVDIPESATVGTLKRAVMDAAMNLLGGGLRVCVLVQGRKVPDEAATLSEMGISHGGKSELGFMLEPTSIPTASNEQDDPLLVLLHAASEPNSRSNYVVDGAWTPDNSQQQPSAAAAAAAGGQISPPEAAQLINKAGAAVKPEADPEEQAKQNESDSTSTLSQATPYKPRVLDAKAIIVHPGMGVGAAGVEGDGLALVPMRPKGHGLEIHKRRIRRPFSVGEVESLVQAVEQLGTGRWRDVKLQAFENAKHRTYVDLKDKWKTLVHTAQIAPHQRRGDPVPQELLDRVIAANNYWAAHQAKEQAELEA